MIRDTVSFLRGEGRRVFVDAEHFFDGYRLDRAYALEACAPRPSRRRGRRPVRHQRRDAARPGRRCRRRRRREHRARASASTATTTPAAPSPTRWPRSRPAPTTSRARSTATASAPATPTSSPSSPTCSSSRGWTSSSRTGCRGHPDLARDQRGHECPALLPPAVRRLQRLRAQGRPARQRDQGRPRPLPAHRPQGRRQRHANARLGHGRPRLHRAQEPRAGLRSRPRRGRGQGGAGARDGQGARAAGLHLRRRRRQLRVAAAPRTRPGALPDFFDVESWRVITDSRGEPTRPSPRRRSSSPRRPSVVADRRGQRPGQRARPRPAPGARGGLPGDRHLELVDYKVRILDADHGTDAVTRVLIETSDGSTTWSDDRGRREHRRGVLGGALRRDHLRPDPGRVRRLPGRAHRAHPARNLRLCGQGGQRHRRRRERGHRVQPGQRRAGRRPVLAVRGHPRVAASRHPRGQRLVRPGRAVGHDAAPWC
jgi:hypothetical protein